MTSGARAGSGSRGVAALLAALLASAWAVATALAAAGQLDPSFSGDGKQTTSFLNDTGSDLGQAVAIQSDGRIVVAGSSTQPGTSTDVALVRYRPNGSLDASFSGDGRRVTRFAGGPVTDLSTDVALQADGKIVVTGFSNQGAAGTKLAVARFRPNGNLDPSFSGDGRRTLSFGNGSDYDDGQTIAIQGDGRIVVAGSSDQGGTGYDFAIARLTSSGSLDPSFSGDGRRTTTFGPGNDFVGEVAIQADGKIVLVGRSMQGATGQDFALARYRADGTLDPTFSGDGKRLTSSEATSIGDAAQGVAIQSNGRIVIAGRSFRGSGTGLDFAVVRYRPDGTLDSSFSGNGKRFTTFSSGNALDEAFEVAIQADGRIVASGTATQSASGQDFAVARYQPNGSLDTTFSGDGKRVTVFGPDSDRGLGVALQPDGRIVVVGDSEQSATGRDFAIARFLAN